MKELVTIDQLKEYDKKKSEKIVLQSEKGEPNGVATLDESGKIPIDSIPTESFIDYIVKLVLNKEHPIGSLYWSSDSTNPSQLFGGTWVQIKDTFILAAGNTYKAGTTGGAATVKLTESNLPAHKHGFTPKGSVSAHVHGLNNHIHSFSNTHKHGQNIECVDGDGWDNSTNKGQGPMVSYTSNVAKDPDSSWKSTGYEGGRGNGIWDKLSWRVFTSNTTISGTTGGNSGNTTSTTPTFTGTADNTSSTGSGTAFNIINPYIVMYCWRRTA